MISPYRARKKKMTSQRTEKETAETLKSRCPVFGVVGSAHSNWMVPFNVLIFRVLCCTKTPIFFAAAAAVALFLILIFRLFEEPTSTIQRSTHSGIALAWSFFFTFGIC